MKMVAGISKTLAENRFFYPAKLRFFSIISLAAIVFIIYANSSTIFDYTQCLEIPKSNKDSSGEILENLKPQNGIKMTTIAGIQLRSMQEHDLEKSDRGKRSMNDRNRWIPPWRKTEKKRIAWFQRKLPEFDIFRSDNLSQRFHRRVLEFFNPSCDFQFFMTWISPVESFKDRDFLAMETLFKAHPHGCLMILSRTMDSIKGYRILKPLLDRGFKVGAVTPDLSFLLRNTPAATWYSEIKKGKRDPGEIPLAQNLSNLMRLAVLYKYGGVYLDTDIIVLKPFTGLRNSIGVQSINGVSRKWTRLNNAVLIFDMNHPLVYKFMEEFAQTFNGNKWGHNGPYLVTRVVQRIGTSPGYNYTVMPHMAFYPVDWNKICGLFKKPENQATSRWVKAKLLQLSGQSYAVHLWNKQSSKLVIEEGSVMQRLISDRCIICRDQSSY